MNRHTAALPVGKLVLESRTGCSSNRVNPFFMVHSPVSSPRASAGCSKRTGALKRPRR